MLFHMRLLPERRQPLCVLMDGLPGVMTHFLSRGLMIQKVVLKLVSAATTFNTISA